MHSVKLVGFFLVISSLVTASEIKVNDKVVPYPAGVKLEFIASQLLDYPDPYWPGSHIRTRSSYQESLALKSDVIKSLQELTNLNKDFKKIYLDINYFNPFGRLIANLDPDWFRLRPADNPLLTGDYEVILTPRPKYVQVVGMTKQGKKIRMGNNPVHTGLIDRALYLDSADLNYIYIIQPSGKVERIGNAYWNYVERDLMPGSIVYIPIEDTTLPDHMKNLNADVLRLLASAEEREQ